jgi:hypothetical protein
LKGVLHILINKKWKHIDDLLTDGSNVYQSCELGIVELNPQKIVALSLSEQEVLNSGKLERLRESITKVGWVDYSPGDLHLILFPNGYYSVCSGGNHRTYLANKLGIPKIKASVTLIIPNELINKEIINKIERIRAENRKNFQLRRDVSKQLNEVKTYSKEFDYLWERANYIDKGINILDKQINDLLKRKLMI